MNSVKFLMVYVHLGASFPPTLDFLNRPSSHKNDGGLRILITDNPDHQLKFDGRIIVHSEKSLASLALLKKHRYYANLASGYWLYTFERLFALRALKDLPGISSLPIIHMESDVLPLFDSTDLKFLCNNFTNVAVPRFSETLGIGSIVFSPNMATLLSALEKLEKLAIQNIDVLDNDMQLLGMALNQDIILELPSHPSDYDKVTYNSLTDYRILFDGAALGQYLFGQDPFHQSGQRYSGFKNPSYSEITDIESMKWRLVGNSQESRLMIDVDGIKYKIVNLHIHSKEVLPPFSIHSERWIRAIQEANGFIDRQCEHTSDVSPHSKRPNIWLRLQIARSKGLRTSVFDFIKRRLL